MKWLKRIFDFYIKSSMHVALAVCSLTIITFWELEYSPSILLILYIFFGSITGYNFVKYAGVAGLHHRTLTDSLKAIQIFSALCFIGVLLLSLCFTIEFLLRCFPLGILTILYATPILPRNNNLRTIPSLKIFVIAAVWSITVVYIPVQYLALNWSVGHTILLLQRFILILILIIPFEIRDLKYDKPKLATIPQLAGIKKTKAIGYGLCGIYILLEYLKNSSLKNVLSTTIILGLSIVALYFSQKDQDDYYASFWVESIPILWCLSFLIF